MSRSAFAGFRFPTEVITVALRWYLRYGRTYLDVEELSAERGVQVDHVTIYGWVQRFTTPFADAARSALIASCGRPKDSADLTGSRDDNASPSLTDPHEVTGQGDAIEDTEPGTGAADNAKAPAQGLRRNAAAFHVWGNEAMNLVTTCAGPRPMLRRLHHPNGSRGLEAIDHAGGKHRSEVLGCGAVIAGGYLGGENAAQERGVVRAIDRNRFSKQVTR